MLIQTSTSGAGFFGGEREELRIEYRVSVLPHTTDFSTSECCGTASTSAVTVSIAVFKIDTKVGNGPFVSIDTKGGKPSFAASQ